MKVREDAAYSAFLGTSDEEGWSGVRLAEVREQELRPGGRAILTMFARVGDGRSYPRMQVRMPPAEDPAPPGTMFAPAAAPAGADALRAQIRQALAAHQRTLSLADLDASRAPRGSRFYWYNSIRAQRIATFFAQVHKQLDAWSGSGALSGATGDEARRAAREIEAEVYATDMRFDPETTGTYFSYLHDELFVHYLEMVQDSLPEEGSEGFALLPSQARYAVRRQLDQLRNHLDFLMRHKYAFEVVEETNVERTVGGLLIDRDSRQIVSEVPNADDLDPRYELLRIAPDAAHPQAGAWVYRGDAGKLHLQDGTSVDVDASMLRASPLSSERLTFQRAPRSERPRAGMRLDWDQNGYIQAGKLDWAAWAGHCDIQGIMEVLGLTLADGPRVEEYRSDSDTRGVYDRRLLLEMIASMIELGSVYVRMDGGDVVRLGRHHFGGARNDSLPDRLQLQGLGEGRHFRWPIAGRQDVFRVKAIHVPDDTGKLQQVDMSTAFFRSLPDLDALDFAPNPRYRETVDGDYNVIDASGAVIKVDLLVDAFDERTGYPVQRPRETVIDLRPEPDGDRFFLGTHMGDPAKRQIYRVYLDRGKSRIVAALDVYEKRDGTWMPRTVDEESFVLPLAAPMKGTLSHEMRRDHPEVYQTLLDIALRQGQAICADTDMAAAVWNGMVTRMAMRKQGENRAARVEHWRVDVEARFGRARLDYLLRRNEVGEPVDFCPAVGESADEPWVDFLWQDLPDVGSRAFEDGRWVANATMLQRHMIEVVEEPSAPGGLRVHDEHVENVYEMIFAALAGYPYTIVHAGERHGFRDRSAWEQAVRLLKQRRRKLAFE